MLAELRLLARSLDRSGIGVASRDPRLRPYAKRPALRVELGVDGDIVRIGLIPKDELARLLTFQVSTGGFQESTPGFAIVPLLALPEGVTIPRALSGSSSPPETRAELLAELVAASSPTWEENTAKGIEKRLIDAPRTLLSLLPPEESAHPELAALCLLLERSMRLSSTGFRDRLLDAASRSLPATTSAAEAAALVGLLFRKRPNDRVTLVLELDEPSRPDGVPANTERTFDLVNKALASGRGDSRPDPRLWDDPASVDVFGGPIDSLDTKMPRIPVPRLGNVSLRSLNKALPCQARYGLIEAHACPVGPEARQSLADTLAWATQQEREWKTWAAVSRSCGFEREAILIAYPTDLPESTDPLAQFLAGDSFDTEGREVSFEDLASRITGRLRARDRREPGAEIRVFVLLRADVARTRVLYSGAFSMERIVAAGDDWSLGVRNLPPILIRSFDEASASDRGIAWKGPLIPTPAALVSCLNMCWLRGGNDARKVPGLTIGDGITLLLEDETRIRPLLDRALALAIRNGGTLLLAIGQAQHRGRIFVPGERAARIFLSQHGHARIWPAALGLLLHKLGCDGAHVMRTAPFLVGRLLSIADTLHHQYCVAVRDGSVPPSLVGGSMMSLALEDPSAAIAQLAQRLQVYLAWAKTARGAAGPGGRAVGLARWALSEFGTISDELASLGPLPRSCDNQAKAQMLLGYLARSRRAAAETPIDADEELADDRA